MTLAPGDMILTGTPEGLRDVRPGDEVATEIEASGAWSTRSSATQMPSRKPHMIKHLIDGEPVASREVFETLNPATSEVIDEVASGGEAEVAAAVAAAKRAFPAWAAKPAAERARLMRRLGDLIAQNVPQLAALETDDTGQVIAQTTKALVPRAADNFYFFSEVCTRMDGECYQSDEQHLSYTLYQPVGVCALISPWNVPFMTATWKTAPCLALGNTAVLKMSELSPVTADRLGQLALEAGIPPGVLNVVHGFGATAGDALVRHPDVRAISFTGSTATGNKIVSRAGLKKFSMELGGKSPFIVFDDADQERALDAAVFMIFSNNGERCTAGSRILVQDRIYDAFVDRFAARARKLKVGDPMDEATIIGPMISRAHWDKVHRLHRERPQGRREAGRGRRRAELRGQAAQRQLGARRPCSPTWTTA